MFEDMLERLRRTVTWLFHMSNYARLKSKLPRNKSSPASGKNLQRRLKPHTGVGRNDPCPCGSGKKYGNIATARQAIGVMPLMGYDHHDKISAHLR